VEVHVAVAIEIAEGTGVRAATLAFELGDDLHAAHFRTAGDGTAGKYRADHLARCHAVAAPPTDVGNDVVHMRIALDRHQLVHAHAAGNADAAEVVALQVNQHHVLGALFGVADQFADARGIVIAGKARARAGDRTRFDDIAAHRHQALG